MNNSRPVSQLPGAGRGASLGDARQYVVTLVRNPAPQRAATDRAQVVSRGLASGEAFKRHLTDFVEKTNRKYELVEIGAPTSFGIISVIGTTGLADAIKSFPEVESIVEDTPTMGLIR